MTKICSTCKIEKPIQNFSKDSTNKHGLCYRCKDCTKINRRKVYLKYREDEIKLAREWCLKNPEKTKSYKLLEKFNIDYDYYKFMLEMQNDVCACCGMKETRKHRSGSIQQLSVDHDHKNGKIRGLLCSSCNTSLGLIKENINTLKEMINYLEKHKEI